MPIPNDHLERWWIEALEVENQQLFDQLKPAILALLAFGPNREPELMGTAFPIASERDIAAIATAKHVLEGIASKQRPTPRHALSSLFIPPSHLQPSLDPKSLKAVWMGAISGDMLDVISTCSMDSTDLACGLISVENKADPKFSPANIPIDTRVPKLRDVVHMVSAGDLRVDEITPPAGGHRIEIHRRIALRIGVVTGVYPHGYRQYKWPCFTTSIPAEGGMSGGFVTLPEDGKTVSACGVVCADNSVEGAYADFGVCGESVIGCMWPILGLQLPTVIPATLGMSRTIYDLMKSGHMPLAVGGLDHIRVTREEDGRITVGAWH